LRQNCYAFVGPFDHTNTAATEVFIEPQVYDFTDAVESVEINVVQSESAVILSNYDEGRTEGILFDTDAPGDTLCQASLAAPQAARKKKHVTGLSQFSELDSQPLSLLWAVRIEL
jgi:hypothetical protein